MFNSLLLGFILGILVPLLVFTVITMNNTETILNELHSTQTQVAK